jgi:hypothetical protein
MAVFWFSTFFISLGFLIAGLIKPSLFSGLFRTEFTRKKAGLISGSLFVIILILGAVFPAKNRESRSSEATSC